MPKLSSHELWDRLTKAEQAAYDTAAAIHAMMIVFWHLTGDDIGNRPWTNSEKNAAESAVMNTYMAVQKSLELFGGQDRVRPVLP